MVHIRTISIFNILTFLVIVLISRCRTPWISVDGHIISYCQCISPLCKSIPSFFVFFLLHSYSVVCIKIDSVLLYFLGLATIVYYSWLYIYALYSRLPLVWRINPLHNNLNFNFYLFHSLAQLARASAMFLLLENKIKQMFVRELYGWCAYLFGNFVVWIFGVVATKLCSSKCKYFLEFSISNDCWSECWSWCWCWCRFSLFERWLPLFQSLDGVDNEGDNAFMLSLRLFFSKWLRLLLFSSLVAFVCNLIELCMFGDAFDAPCNDDAILPVMGDSVDGAVAIAAVVTAPSVTNSIKIVLVAHK